MTKLKLFMSPALNNIAMFISREPGPLQVDGWGNSSQLSIYYITLQIALIDNETVIDFFVRSQLLVVGLGRSLLLPLVSLLSKLSNWTFKISWPQAQLND